MEVTREAGEKVFQLGKEGRQPLECPMTEAERQALEKEVTAVSQETFAVKEEKKRVVQPLNEALKGLETREKQLLDNLAKGVVVRDVPVRRVADFFKGESWVERLDGAEPVEVPDTRRALTQEERQTVLPGVVQEGGQEGQVLDLFARAHRRVEDSPRGEHNEPPPPSERDEGPLVDESPLPAFKPDGEGELAQEHPPTQEDDIPSGADEESEPDTTPGRYDMPEADGWALVIRERRVYLEKVGMEAMGPFLVERHKEGGLLVPEEGSNVTDEWLTAHFDVVEAADVLVNSGRITERLVEAAEEEVVNVSEDAPPPDEGTQDAQPENFTEEQALECAKGLSEYGERAVLALNKVGPISPSRLGVEIQTARPGFIVKRLLEDDLIMGNDAEVTLTVKGNMVAAALEKLAQAKGKKGTR